MKKQFPVLLWLMASFSIGLHALAGPNIGPPPKLAKTLGVNCNLPTPAISTSGKTIFCFNQESVDVTLYAQGTGPFLWSDGTVADSIHISSNTSWDFLQQYGAYQNNWSVQSIAAGCTSAASAVTNVGYASGPEITFSGENYYCPGVPIYGVIKASGTGPFLWSDGSTADSLVVTQPGYYGVQYLINGCQSAPSRAIGVELLVQPTADITASGPTTICPGGSVTLTATGGTSYLWSDGSTGNSLVATSAGSYTVQAISANGCTSSSASPVVVNVISAPAITTSGKTIFCFNQESVDVTLYAQGTGPFLWSDGTVADSIHISANTSWDFLQQYGAYQNNWSVQSIAAGCTSAASAVTTVGYASGPEITFSGKNYYCPGEPIYGVIKTSGPGPFLWSDGSTADSLVVTQTGVYGVAFVVNGCQSAPSRAIAVDVLTQPVADITASGPTTICPGGSVTLTATGGSSYLWSDGSTGNSLVATSAGSYTVQAISANGCTSASSSPVVVTLIPAPDAPYIETIGATTFCPGSSVILKARNGNNFVWSDGLTDSTRRVNTSGTYTVQAISANGCTSAASVATVVTVNNCDNIWTGATSTDWANTANWSGGNLPQSFSDVTIPSAIRFPVVSGQVVIRRLKISAGVNLTVNGTLTLRGNLINSGSIAGTGTLKLASDSVLQTVSGNAFDIANLTIAGQIGARLNTTVGVTQALTLASGTLTTNGNLIIRSNASGTGLIDDFSAGNTGTISGTVKTERYFPSSGWHLVAAPVTGLTLAALGQNCINLLTWSETFNTALPWPANCTSTNFDINAAVFINQNGGTKYTLSGTANTSDYSYNLVRGTGNPLIQRGFNYVANPYPSPISWTSVAATSGLTANSNGTAYIYNPTTATWASISAAGVTTGTANNLIQMGQGIIVRRNNVGTTGATMTFKNSHRVNTGSAFFMRKPITDQALRLVLKSDNSEDDILLYTSPEASVETDNLDAEKLHSHLPVASISSGNDLAINALPTDFNGTVALNLTAPSAGIYGLSVKELGEVNVTLEDKKTGTFTALTPETKLDLNLNERNEGRFALHYGSNSAGSNNTQIFAADKLVTVILPTADNATIEAVNTLGQVVSTINATDKVTRFGLPHDGVYVIRVKSGNGVKSGKVVY